MKLVRLKIIEADTCGGLLNGLEVPFREGSPDGGVFTPLCLIGPNGSGKSQVLQIIAEIFQSIFAKYASDEERGNPNENILFELEYIIASGGDGDKRIRVSRRIDKRKKADLIFEIEKDGEYLQVEDEDKITQVLPAKVVGYTSGDNETLSIPFFVSRAGYANQVRTNAMKPELKDNTIHDSRMLLIDYGTNLEVLVANLLLNPEKVREELIREPNLKELRSFRCVVQLKPKTGPVGGVKLTSELESCIDYLSRCSTCWELNEEKSIYTFDFLVQSATRDAFQSFWRGALHLYSSFHKLAMLNDLVIPKAERELFEKGVKDRRFASRLPEPMERQKVFRFERVEFISKKSEKPVDYVSLSDGEHQLAQILGTLCMVNFPNVLFLLDEPESHFNPHWRVEFISKVMKLDTCGGKRNESSPVAKQDCLITTHSPFVPSDMQRQNVLIFSKSKESESVGVRRPKIQTYGSKFDSILAECFDISPPVSAASRDHLEKLLESGSAEDIEKILKEIGESSLRMRLAGRLAKLKGS